MKELRKVLKQEKIESDMETNSEFHKENKRKFLKYF